MGASLYGSTQDDNPTVLYADTDGILRQRDNNQLNQFVQGTVNHLNGIVELTYYHGFRLLMQSRILCTAVAVRSIPLDASLIGIDPVRMPSDGRVSIVQSGQAGVIHYTGETTLGAGLASGQVSTMPETNLAWVEIYDALNVRVPEDRFTLDKTAGTITWDNPIDLAGFVEPLTVHWRIEELRLVTDVEFTGKVTLSRPLLRDYPAGTQFSTLLNFGDRFCYIAAFFRQTTWSSVWSDTVIGSIATGSYADHLYPIELTNSGAIPERWALVFTAATTFNLIGEQLGTIAVSQSTANDLAPINPATGVPYFRLRKEGWSAGWASGNALRFNTRGPVAPFWVTRTTQIDPDGFGADDFRIELRGDAQ